MGVDIHLLRPCVGIILYRSDKKVWIGERCDHPWEFQFPQGGIDPGETAQDTALRELFEETGIDASFVKIIDESNEWHISMWPKEVQEIVYQKHKKSQPVKFQGQRQKWFLIKLLCDHDPTCLTRHHPQEFISHKWVDILDIVNTVVEFKRPVYKAVYEEFERYFYG